MGWNTGYTIFEATVVGAYDLGKLDKDLLEVLMEPYRGTDIDRGGSADLESEDGKKVEEIVIEAFGLEMLTRPDGEYDDNPAAWSRYNKDVYEKMKEITDYFGWD
jgi:hypothetical protein